MTAPPTIVSVAARSDVIKGIAYLVAAVFSFSVLDSLAKTLAQRYPVMMVVWVRYLGHVLFMLAILAPRMRWRLVHTRRPFVQTLRGLALGLSSISFICGLQRMPLAEASAICQIAPVLITLLAVRWLGETAPRGTWWALLVSFAGVLMIARPGTAIFDWAALFPVVTALMVAAYQLLTRLLANVDDGLTTLFLGGVTATAVATLAVPFYWAWPASALDWLLFMGTGAVGAFSHMLMVRAYENAPASALAPFAYFQVASALIMGALVFGTFPDEWALAGMLMIVGTGVVMALLRRRSAMAMPLAKG